MFLKYGLHDTEITSVSAESDSISFLFADGVYLLDEKGRETTRTGKCELKIFFDYNVENTVFFSKIAKNRIKEIDFDEFCKLLKKARFIINADYYSDFLKSILLIGNVDKFLIGIQMTDIKKAEFVF